LGQRLLGSILPLRLVSLLQTVLILNSGAVSSARGIVTGTGSRRTEGLIIIQTVWATTPDRRRGHRLTRFEGVADQVTLIQRLAELTPALWPSREAIPAAPNVAIGRP
jgi:hypothetical protein